MCGAVANHLEKGDRHDVGSRDRHWTDRVKGYVFILGLPPRCHCVRDV